MRIKFEEQLANLNNTLIAMGGVVEQSIADAVKALVEQDVELAKKVMAADNEIDQMEKEIESMCLKLILRQQPVAGDLRLVSSVLKIITDLERIGDQAADISEISIFLAGTQYIRNLEHIQSMATSTMMMVAKSIEAFVKKDLTLAREVIAHDDKVDDLFGRVKKDLIEMIKENAGDGDQAIDILMIAKYFERIADHATNVAEWVVFTITGTHKDSKIL